MKLSIALTALLAGSCFATGVAAAGPLNAKLQSPVEHRVRVVAGGSMFACEGDTCTATSPGANALTTMGCRALVRAVGAISAYGTASKRLSAERIAECNAWASAKGAAAEKASH